MRHRGQLHCDFVFWFGFFFPRYLSRLKVPQSRVHASTLISIYTARRLWDVMSLSIWMLARDRFIVATALLIISWSEAPSWLHKWMHQNVTWLPSIQTAWIKKQTKTTRLIHKQSSIINYCKSYPHSVPYSKLNWTYILLLQKISGTFKMRLKET